jgi:hypothetical protein
MLLTTSYDNAYDVLRMPILLLLLSSSYQVLSFCQLSGYRQGHSMVALKHLYICPGDVNFASDLSDLRHRQKFHVIVLHSDRSASALLACAHEAFSFTELVADVSPRVPEKKTVVRQG